jgi:hypothetical protein
VKIIDKVGCTRHSGVIDMHSGDTAVTLDLIFERLWLPLKGISIEKTYIGPIPIIFKPKIWG